MKSSIRKIWRKPVLMVLSVLNTSGDAGGNAMDAFNEMSTAQS